MQEVSSDSMAITKRQRLIMSTGGLGVIGIQSIVK